LTAALLLAKCGHQVTLCESAKNLGGLWAARLNEGNYFESENSCKVFQSSYKTTPALFRLIGTRWQDHFTARHDLSRHWLRPFVADCTYADLRRFITALLIYITGIKSYRSESVEHFMARKHFSQSCQEWMRATALGGITGTLRMTVWELFHRIKFNLSSLFAESTDLLYWNKQPPNSSEGFIPFWEAALKEVGVQIKLNCEVESLTKASSASSNSQVKISCFDGSHSLADAIVLAMPSPALSRLLINSHPAWTDGWGFPGDQIHTVLTALKYEHLGICWVFDEPFKNDLPLGGHAVRCGWYPILVQYSQYENNLKPPAKTVVIGSISLNTEFKHHRTGTLARDHDPKELASILWEDEQRADPLLPDPISINVYGLSAATQIVDFGPLAIKNEHAPLYLATSLNGKAPYFTASVESAILAGNAASRALDESVLQLPT